MKKCLLKFGSSKGTHLFYWCIPEDNSTDKSEYIDDK